MQKPERGFPDVGVVYQKQITSTNPEPGLTRRVGAHNDKLFLAEHRMEKGWVGARHSHPHDQVVYIVQGHLKVSCGEQNFEVRTGESFVVRGGVEHQAAALEPSVVIDVFTPCRLDYL
ncbi:MAG TPA: cupin domain-containing protein [Terriglobales bacterium]|nr:cupin domain-containing protein [Terriglobales bacterium]